jgi:hypothetical protein
VQRAYATGTGHTDDAYVRGILHAAHTSQISTGIRAPVAQKRHNPGVPVLLILLILFCHIYRPLGIFTSAANKETLKAS